MDEPTDTRSTGPTGPAGVPVPLGDAVDAALSSYPPAPLPPNFVALTMARAVPAGAGMVPTRPRLGFLDIALPAFCAAVSAVTLALMTGAVVLDPLLAARAALWLDVTWGTLLPGVPEPGALALTALAAGAGVAVLAVSAVLDRTRRAYGPVRGT